MVNALAVLGPPPEDSYRCVGREAVLSIHRHTPSTENNTDSIASTTLTRKIASTTARVVRRPTDSALFETCMPSKQPTTAMMPANNGALTRPTNRLGASTESWSWVKNRPNVMSGDILATTAPPKQIGKATWREKGW